MREEDRKEFFTDQALTGEPLREKLEWAVQRGVRRVETVMRYLPGADPAEVETVLGEILPRHTAAPAETARARARVGLREREAQRFRVRATFERYGTKPGWQGRTEETILFKNIVRADTGEVLADHLWFNKTGGFQKLGPLKSGDRVEFDARVKQYWKGYFGRRWEAQLDNPPQKSYKLSHPTRIVKVSE